MALKKPEYKSIWESQPLRNVSANSDIAQTNVHSSLIYVVSEI